MNSRPTLSVIVLDAGSATPLEENFVKSFGENFRLVRATPLPGVAIWNEQKLRVTLVPERWTPRPRSQLGVLFF